MTTGDRLLYLRQMNKSSRKEMEILTGGKVKMSALAQIESSRNTLTIENALSVLSALKSKGIVCTLDWLYTGEGYPPKKLDVMNDPFNIVEESNFFVENNPGSQISIINDDNFSPELTKGDYVGFKKIDRFLVKNSSTSSSMYRLLLCDGTTILARIIYNKDRSLYIVYKNNMTDINLYSDEDINSIEQVIWIRKYM